MSTSTHTKEPWTLAVWVTFGYSLVGRYLVGGHRHVHHCYSVAGL